MRHLDIMEEGGYPFDDISIDYLQKMHDDRDSFLYAVFGDNKIVAGITYNLQNNMYSDGLITVNGRLYHFVGGAQQSTISKKTIITKRQYEDGVEKKAFINEFYEFGSGGTDVINFSSLKRWYKNEPVIREIKQIAGPVANNDLPEGWFIADGTNGTDDLRSMFIVGYDIRDTDYNQVGKTGGEKKHILSVSEMPRHNHTVKNYAGIAGAAQNSHISSSVNGPSGAQTSDVGGNQPHENRPPYYVAVLIQFIGA